MNEYDKDHDYRKDIGLPEKDPLLNDRWFGAYLRVVKLLRKYIEHIECCEGINYLDDGWIHEVHTPRTKGDFKQLQHIRDHVLLSPIAGKESDPPE